MQIKQNSIKKASQKLEKPLIYIENELHF